MKAAYIERIGPPEYIRYDDLEKPALEDTQVLVKVAAVAVNPIDTYIRSGAYPIKLPIPFIIGRDMVGTVKAVGRSVHGFSPGARVWCNNQGYDGRQGTFAEYLAVDEDLLYPLPDGADEKETVAVVHSAFTAWIGLVREAKLRTGEAVFINGGAGNVGSATMQLAHNLGARVLVTAGSADRVQQCLELGADRAINYKTEDVVKAISDFVPQGVDVYWDTTRQPDFERAVPLMAHRGRIIVMAGLDAHPTFLVGAFYTKDCSMHGFAVTNATPAELRDGAGVINRWLSEGRLRGKIDRIMGLAEAAAAHRLVEDPHAELKGKIVLVP